MTAPTREVTRRGRRTWWWVAGGVLTVLAVVAIVWFLLGQDEDDTTAQVQPTPAVTVEPTPTPEATPEPTTPPEPEPTTELEPAPEPDAQALPGATLGPFSGGQTPPVGGSWIADVRTAGHAGYDRVVFEFDGGVVPTYQVAYTPTSGPFHDLPGDVVPIQGQAFLDVWLQGTSRVDMTDDYAPVYTGPTRLRSDTATVTEVVEIEDFEANVHWLIGLDTRSPFVAWTADSPARLVIDVSN